MQKLPKKDELDVFCLLDEAGHIKVSSHFSSIITNIRKYRVSISLIVQSLSQLENLY
jgi:type IV secretion system protein VirD4